MRLEWDKTGERTYETGCDHGVLFVMGTGGTYGKGVVWNGLTGVTESPSGAESSPQYADNIKYLNLVSAEDFGATIEALTYPKEWAACNGEVEAAPGVIIGQQSRKVFGMSYRSKVGNDVDGQEHGYKIHLLYGCQAAPSERAYQTINDSPEPIPFSWEISTVPVNVTGHMPTALATIDSTLTTPEKMKTLEDIIYGTDSNEPRLPLPDEVIELLKDSTEVSG